MQWDTNDKALKPNVLQATILNEPATGTDVRIFPVRLSPFDAPFKFIRLQYPIKNFVLR